MKILILADTNSPHTIKWVNSLDEYGVNIILLGIGNTDKKNYDKTSSTKIIDLKMDINRSRNDFFKLKYLFGLFKIKKVISEYKPEILHAHYATSYGLLGALTLFNPFVISVWGSDIYIFPKKSWLHKLILKFILSKANKILSTSYAMARETSLYTKKTIDVIPFGINLTNIEVKKEKINLFPEQTIVIGTVKSLERVYGINFLIEAFKKIKEKYPHIPLALLIVGDGSERRNLQKMVNDLGVQDQTIFVGHIPPSDIFKYHEIITIPVFLSNSESFGVAVVEASASKKPVIVSNVGGLPEVVEHNITGLIVPPQDSSAAAQAIETLILNKKLRDDFGQAGYEKVKKSYNWAANIQKMITTYEAIINSNK